MSPVVPAVAAALAGARGRIFVGYSGGLDSTVLLHAAASLRRDVVAVHVDHGLHPDSPSWAEHCAATAQRLGVACRLRRVEVAGGPGLEARARAARYRSFAGLLVAADDCLLLAHHRNDQAETGLLRLLQGRGLYGMPVERSLAAGRLLRPLLCVSRTQIEAHARTQGLSWIDDPMNLDLRLDRNYLRQRLLPALRECWPAVDEALLEAMSAAREVDARVFAALGANRHGTRLPVSLLEEPPAVGLHRLRVWLHGNGVPVPTRAALEEFLHQALTAGRDRQPRLVLGDGSALIRHRDSVHLVTPPPSLADCYPLSLPGRLRLPHGELTIAPAGDGVQPMPPVTVRFRCGGEHLRTAGRRRSVKQLLQRSGLAPWERETLPLVWDARGLLALPGLAVRDPQPGEEGPRFRISWSPG